MRSPAQLTSSAAFALLLLSQAGCDRREIEVYSVAKEAGIEVPEASSAVELPNLIPAGWQSAEPTGPRVASFRVTGADTAADPADMAVTVFPGDVGGLLANVNRWRGEVSQPPVTQENLEDALGELEVDGHKLHIVDAASADRRTLGAILPLGAETWFFKLSGPIAVVTENEQAFEDYLGGLQIGGAAAPPEVEAAPEQPEFAFEKPEAWIQGEANSPRVASFTVTGSDGAEADIAVIPLGTSAGAGLANVNMWRSTLQLEPASEEQLPELIEKLDVNGQPFQLVDFESENAMLDGDGKARIIVAYATVGDHTWYFKIAGESELVSEQKPALLEFLQSVEFGK